MAEPAQKDPADVFGVLRDGNMLSHPGVRFHVNRALSTGDTSRLHQYLQRVPQILSVAQRNIALAEHQKAECAFRPYPTRQDAREYLSGPLKLGYVNEFDDIFGIDWDTLAMPVMNAGRVKGGKSILVKYMLCQMLRRPRKFNVLIPDLKGEYRNLLPYCRHLKVLKSEVIKINPFEVPPWRDPTEHIIAVAKVFVSENYLLGTSLNELISVLMWLYNERGIFNGSTKYPTVVDVYKAISAKLTKSKGYRYVDVLRWLQNRLFPYTVSDTYKCRRGIPFDVLRTKNLILEMDKGFTDHIYNFTVAYIAELLYSYNKAKGLTGSKLRHLFNVDEARILFNAKRDVSRYGESILNEIVSKSREFGIGFLLSSQETASFNQVIRSLAYLKIAFPLNDAEDLDFIGKSWGLNEDQVAYLFQLPPCSRAVVRYGGHKDPFLLQVPHFRIPRQLADENVDQRMAPFYAELRGKVRPTHPSGPMEIIAAMPLPAAALLYFLGNEPFSKISDMTKTSGLRSPAKVKKALDWLEAHGFLKCESYRISSKGRPPKYAVLSKKAYTYLDKMSPHGKGGFEHSLYQHVIANRLLDRGKDASVEGRIKGSHKLIDVLAKEKDGSYVAYEVSLEFGNLISNIVQNLEAGARKVVIVTRNLGELETARGIVAKDNSLDQDRGRISFCTISDFSD
jgi:predicted transcriptional regulator